MLVLLLKLSGTQRILINFIMILKSHMYAFTIKSYFNSNHLLFRFRIIIIILKRPWSDFSDVVLVIKV